MQFEISSRTQVEVEERTLPARSPRARPHILSIRDAALFHPAGSPSIIASRWCESGSKRVFDFSASLLVFLLTSPFLLFLCVLVRLTSPGPAIFRQKRVGRHGIEFTIYKLRTMHHSVGGSKRSSHADHRLTPPGLWLRKYKLDELPQLFNVILGHMSLVGPRPKLRGHESLDIHFRPGITGAATLAFAAEEHLLRHISPEHLEDCHSQLISPRKLQMDLEYMARATFRTDLCLLWHTLLRRGRYRDLDQIGCWQPPARQTARPAALRVESSVQPANRKIVAKRGTGTL